MKKFLGILALVVLTLSVFILIPKKAGAKKPVFNSGSQDELENAKQISLGILRNRASFRAIGNADDFAIQKVEIDSLKMAHTHVRQVIDQIPVWEGEAIVHLTPQGELSTITDELKENIAVNTQPNLSSAAAIKMATAGGIRSSAQDSFEKPTADLWIYRGEDRDHLAYRVRIRREDDSTNPSMPVIFIDAQTGEKIFQYDNLQTATGVSRYSGTVTLDTSSSGGTYYLEDLTRKMGTFNMNSTGNESTGTGGTQSRYTDTDDVWNSSIQTAGVDAHYGAAKTYDYYKNIHGRVGIDGSGGPGNTTAAANSSISLITSRVHFGSSGHFNNAFWDGTKMNYGDGDGSTFTPLTTIDICGHEMTHGVTERTAALTYAKEPGALNEAVSDIFGAMVERYAEGESSNTWLIGEEAYTPGTAGDALRYMNNPTAGGQPAHYADRAYAGTCTSSSSNDNCGVHTNSGIANYAFYLMAKGGTTSRGATVVGTNADDMARIWYRALTVYMTSGTTFAGARTATLNAATDIFGASSAQYNSVSTAWCAVGVGTCTAPTPTPTATPTATPTPTPGGGGELLVNGGFESVVSPWVNSGTGAFYTNNGSAPHGGTGYDYFGVNDSVTGQTYQQVAIPTTATGTLTFWLNVTSSETTTSTQYDKLFVEVRNTAGTLLTTLATYSNLNKGTAGVYSQKSFSLAAYKGQTVRIQFRSTTDSSVTTTFRVDDVSLK